MAEAIVTRRDLGQEAVFSAADKLAWLERHTADPSRAFGDRIERAGLDDFMPIPFSGLDWVSLAAAFRTKSSGIESKRDAFVYAFADRTLNERVASLRQGRPEALRIFSETDQRTVERAIAVPLKDGEIIVAGYRPFDERKLLCADRFLDRPRPTLQATWGSTNTCLFALPTGTGVGPGCWAYAQLPDRHAFRGSYGGYAFPLWDRRRGPAAHNLNAALLEGLATAYGRAVSPDEVFCATIALLSATSYTTRFASDLEEAFPHIPFPADPAVFAEAARIGAEILALETFGRSPAEGFRTARLSGQTAAETLAVPSLGQAFVPDGSGNGAVALVSDQALKLVGVPERVYAFAVSGYRVLYRWLAAREGERLADVQTGALDLVWRLSELLHWFDKADSALAAAIADPLTRKRLGLTTTAP